MGLTQTLPYVNFDMTVEPSHAKLDEDVPHEGQLVPIVIIGIDGPDCKSFYEHLDRSKVTESTTYYTTKLKEQGIRRILH